MQRPARRLALAACALATLLALAAGSAQAADGSGTMVAAPTSVSAGSNGNTLTFTYTAAETMTDGELQLTVPSGWTAPSSGSVTTSAGTLSISDRTIVISGLNLASGDQVQIVYGAATAPTAAGPSTFPAQQKSTAGGTPTDLATSPTVTVVPAGLNSFIVNATGGGAIPTQTAGQSFAIKLTAQDQYGNTETDFGGTVTVSSNKTCSAGCGTSASFSSGILVHTLTLTQAGPGATVSVTRTGGPQNGTSNSFTVAPGAADHLTLTGSTADLVAGSSRTLTAEIEDAFDNMVDSTAPVAFAKTGGTGAVTGLGSSSASGGTASRQVVGDKWGAVTIRASSNGVTGASISFKVVPGPAKRLVFTMSTGQLKLGTSALLAVEIQDAHGNRVPSPARGVTFAQAAGAGRVAGLGKVKSEAGVVWALIDALKIGPVTVKATALGLTAARVKFQIVK